MSYHPQTPQSPSQNSPATTDATSNVNSTMSSFTTALPTPAHSINGTNLPSEASQDVIMGGDSPQKRKREHGDHGEHAREKRVHIDDGIPSMDAIHQDVGEKYLLGKRTWTPARPLLSDDLFELYNLTDIAADVARVRPDGSKNGLRKTYKGQIKKFGLTGHFDAVKKEYTDELSLLQMLDCPEDVWEVNLVKGKEIADGFRPSVKQALPRATTMARGSIAKSKWDSSVLAEFAGDKPAKGSSSAKPTGTAPGTPLNPALGLPRSKTQVSGPRNANRALRDKAKRSYNDGSFEGYEGFEDDTGLDTGYSTGEGESKKRRKKVHRVLTSGDICVLTQLLTRYRMLRPALVHRARCILVALATWVPERPTFCVDNSLLAAVDVVLQAEVSARDKQASSTQDLPRSSSTRKDKSIQLRSIRRFPRKQASKQASTRPRDRPATKTAGISYEWKRHTHKYQSYPL